MDIKKDIRFRAYLTFTLMLMFALAIVGRIAYIQIVKGDELRALSQKINSKPETLLPQRGNIITEDGKLLSSTKTLFDIRIDFKTIDREFFYENVDTLAGKLSFLYPEKSKMLFKKELMAGYDRGDRYYLLKKGIPYYQYQLIRSFPIFEKGGGRGGFIPENKPKRENPYGILAYRTIGLWRENAKTIGLERTYDTLLSGKEGSRIMRKASGGVWIPVKESVIDPINGRDIVTTIDIDIQEVAENALMQTLEEHKCQFGSVIVMETETGKIRALANLGRQADGTYWEDYNYAMALSEPGSTFKLMSLYALLEDGYVTIEDKASAYGGIKYFGSQRIRDDHLGMGTLPIKTAFAKSSNVVFASLVHKYYHDKPMQYIKHLQKLHLNEKTGIDLIGETTPTIKTTKSKSWNNVTSLPWIAYGYESLITPMHTLMVYNAVANNGKMVKPYLVSEIRDYGKTIRKIEPTVLVEKIGKQSTIDQLKAAMREVVINGTGRKVQSPFYNSAGKTGTAQVAGKGFSYADGIKQGSFVGFFPYENPKYTIAVLVRNTPHGAYYGATVAAPVFKIVADKLYARHIGGWSPPNDSIVNNSYDIKLASTATYSNALSPLGIKLNTAKEEFTIAKLLADNKKYSMQSQVINGKKMPDLSGMGLKDAVYILENTGLKVSVNGFGKVIAQSIAPGSDFKKGQLISIQLG